MKNIKSYIYNPINFLRLRRLWDLKIWDNFHQVRNHFNICKHIQPNKKMKYTATDINIRMEPIRADIRCLFSNPKYTRIWDQITYTVGTDNAYINICTTLEKK
jgi:hypothetical protein